MTSASELARWDDLLERQAEGEALDAAERAFMADYATRNPDAAAELEILHGLGAALERAARDEQPGDRELAARVFEQGRAERRREWRRGALAAGLGLAGLAAGLVFWWARPHVVASTGGQVVAATSGHAELRPAVMRLSAPVAGLTIDGARATTEAPVRQDQRIETREQGACFQFYGRSPARACLGPGSVARVASLDADVRLELDRGVITAELEHQTPGTSFELQTGSVVVRAVGTRFGLEVAAASFLNVLAGTVEVRGDGPIYRVSAPNRTELGTHLSAPLGEQPAQSGSTAATMSSSAPTVSAAASAGELLTRARNERAQGSMRDAARSYRRLIGEYPSSSEALTARVALGQLELSSLADAPSALAHFTEYLRRGGPLEQEARYGQVRALAALSRSAEEKQAIAAFLAKYPKALQAAALRERLKALGSAPLDQ